MVKREEITFPSADEKTTIHAYFWTPGVQPKAVLHIVHGMAEHILRYEEFAQAMCRCGIAVAGMDLLGHGKSVIDKSKLGYFAEKDGNAVVLKDIRTLECRIRERFVQLPLFLLGHSMGSFLVRQYMAEYGDCLSGVIVMGTGVRPGLITDFVKKLTKENALRKGWEYRSPFIQNLALGNNNKRFGEKGGFEWLSRRKENVENYKADPLNGFCFTLNGFYWMFESLCQVADPACVSKTKKDLPILLVSGTEDPVGRFGSDVKKLAADYRQLGMEHVTVKLYKGDRHEILNEDDRETVYSDIADWILRIVAEKGRAANRQSR